jgi:hypothetical protein
VFNAATPSLVTLRSEKGGKYPFALLVALISQFSEFFNVPEPMGEFQVNTTADIILETYHYLTVADFILFFRRAMAGKYGKVYNRLDGQVILEMLAKYDVERAEAATTEEINKAKATLYQQGEEVDLYAQYLERLRKRAAGGDREAIEAIKRSKELNGNKYE